MKDDPCLQSTGRTPLHKAKSESRRSDSSGSGVVDSDEEGFGSVAELPKPKQNDTFLNKWNTSAFGNNEQKALPENIGLAGDYDEHKAKPRLSKHMTIEAYESVMKEIFYENSDKKGNITRESFKGWMVACSKANN